MNVPETAIAVVASATASRRQRIQRLGRVLRPARGKKAAIVYTIYATAQEQARLEEEERTLSGVACVRWLQSGKSDGPDTDKR
jgi:superfamily II DNA or RNA helicase